MNKDSNSATQSVFVRLNKHDYLRLRSLLLYRHMSFAEWVREHIAEELAKTSK